MRRTGSSSHHVGSSAAAHAFSSCGTWDPSAQPPVVAVNRLSFSTECGVLLLRPGIEPTSPALQGGFLTTGPPGKSPKPRFVCVGSRNSLHGFQPLYIPLNMGKLLLTSCLPSSGIELLLILGDSNQLPPTLESLS